MSEFLPFCRLARKGQHLLGIQQRHGSVGTASARVTGTAHSELAAELEETGEALPVAAIISTQRTRQARGANHSRKWLLRASQRREPQLQSQEASSNRCCPRSWSSSGRLHGLHTSTLQLQSLAILMSQGRKVANTNLCYIFRRTISL